MALTVEPSAFIVESVERLSRLKARSEIKEHKTNSATMMKMVGLKNIFLNSAFTNLNIFMKTP